MIYFRTDPAVTTYFAQIKKPDHAREPLMIHLSHQQPLCPRPHQNKYFLGSISSHYSVAFGRSPALPKNIARSIAQLRFKYDDKMVLIMHQAFTGKQQNYILQLASWYCVLGTVFIALSTLLAKATFKLSQPNKRAIYRVESLPDYCIV